MAGLCETLNCDLNDEELQSQCRNLKALVEKLSAYLREDTESDTESSFSDDSDLEKSLDDTIRALQTYIGCLAKLTLSLEHPAPDPVDTEVEDLDSASFKVLEAVDHWCRMIMDKFKNIDIKLAERLGEANWLRYQRISRMLEEASDRELTDQDEGDELEQSAVLYEESTISTATKSTFMSSSIFDNQPKSQQSSANFTSTLPSAAEYAFQDVSKKIQKDSESQTTWTSFNSDMIYSGQLRVPTLPSEALTKKTFRCTVCGDRLRTITDRLAWK